MTNTIKTTLARFCKSKHSNTLAHSCKTRARALFMRSFAICRAKPLQERYLRALALLPLKGSATTPLRLRRGVVAAPLSVLLNAGTRQIGPDHD
jgi:hypothetical protein